MFSLADMFQNRRRRRRDTLKKQASIMAPYVRNSLSHDILSTTTVSDQELEELDRGLEQSKTQLEKAVESERFVGMRVERYRQLLQQRARELQVVKSPSDDEFQDEADRGAALPKHEDDATYQEGVALPDDDESDDEDDGDEEVGMKQRPTYTPEERERLVAKLKRDQEALAKVQNTHSQLVENVRNLRKQILMLERKRADILGKTEECQDFVQAVAFVQHEEEEGDDGRAVSVGRLDVEMSELRDTKGDDGAVEEYKEADDMDCKPPAFT